MALALLMEALFAYWDGGCYGFCERNGV